MQKHTAATTAVAGKKIYNRITEKDISWLRRKGIPLKYILMQVRFLKITT